MAAMSVMAPAASYGQAPDIDEDMRTFEGTVVSVDPVNLSLAVLGAVQIVFPISADTQFVKDGAPIQLTDIERGDYVFVEYHALPENSLVPARVLQVTLKYKKGDSW